MSDNTDFSAKLKESQDKISTELRDLKQVILQEIDKYKARSRENLDKTNSSLNDERTKLKETLVKQIKKYEDFTNSKFGELTESYQGQLDSLRMYTTQIVDEDEKTQVGTLETSFANAKDITNSQTSKLTSLVQKVNEVADKSVVKSLEITSEAHNAVKAELEEELKMNKEAMQSEISNLQSNFQEGLQEKIESVFFGVKKTKEEINGIIKDTISRLEENLNRLTEGIDENFTSEIGETQDLIHEYEGKLLEAIENTANNYDSHMVELMQKHSQKTQGSLNNMKSDLETFKSGIQKEIQGLTKEQAELFANATQLLEERLAQSRKEVIDSHGLLKDELEKILTANKESLEETMNKLRTSYGENLSSVSNSVTQSHQDSQHKLSTLFSKSKEDLDKTVHEIENHTKQRISTAETSVKEMSSK